MRHVAVIARRTATRLDDFAMRVLHATYWPVIAVLAVYAGSLTLELPQRVEIIIARVAVISILTQLALWPSINKGGCHDTCNYLDRI